MAGEYFGSLSFYLHKPVLDLSLRDLDDVCMKRVQLLKDLELKLENGGEGVEFDVRAKDSEAGFYSIKKDTEDLSSMKDEASHFLLKLAFCDGSDGCRWFVRHETQLFSRRLEKYLPLKNDSAFLRNQLGIGYHSTEREGVSGYNVPLHHATHLLSKDICYPVQGFVFVPGTYLKQVTSKLFEGLLEYSLIEAQKCLQEIMGDDRIAQILRRIKNPSAGAVLRPIESKAKLKLTMLEDATKHFPPCMKVLYQNLKHDHHLKHYGRLQFGLFLKSVGLSFEDSLQFWKAEFCQKMAPDKFHKDYEYNIKHSYGKVGKMVDYTSQGCSKLSHMPQPAAQEHHGCPFRHLDRGELTKTLVSYGINPMELAPILEKAENHPQVACVRLFQVSHKGAPEGALEHVGHFPSAFYEASRRLQIM